MKTVAEMAREVKMPYDFETGEPINLEKLKAFADLVRADQRQWVGLTDEEIDEWTPEIHAVIRAVEAKLKEKNNG